MVRTCFNHIRPSIEPSNNLLYFLFLFLSKSGPSRLLRLSIHYTMVTRFITMAVFREVFLTMAYLLVVGEVYANIYVLNLRTIR